MSGDRQQHVGRHPDCQPAILVVDAQPDLEGLDVTLGPADVALRGERGVDADFATQRDVSRTKRDIKTFEIRLRCDNAGRDLAVGMTAYVILPLASGQRPTRASM